MSFHSEWWKDRSKCHHASLDRPCADSTPTKKPAIDYGSFHPKNNRYSSKANGNTDRQWGNGEPSKVFNQVADSVYDPCGNGKRSHEEFTLIVQEENVDGIIIDASEITSSRSNSITDSSCDNVRRTNKDQDLSCGDSDQHIIEPPHKTCGLLFFDFVRFIAINANCRLINTEMMPVVLAWGKKSRNTGMVDPKMEVLHVALRLFMSLFSLLLLMIEFPDTFSILQFTPPSFTTLPTQQQQLAVTNPPLTLYNWIPRGIFYIFLSVICFEQSIVVRALDMDEHLSTTSRFFDSIPIVLSAWVMLVTGGMYILLGMCCLQKVMERVRLEEKELWKEYYEDLKQMERQEMEVEEQEWLTEQESRGECAGAFGCCRSVYISHRRWYGRYARRRRRGEGWCSILGCRSFDWRC